MCHYIKEYCLVFLICAIIPALSKQCRGVDDKIYQMTVVHNNVNYCCDYDNYETINCSEKFGVLFIDLGDDDKRRKKYKHISWIDYETYSRNGNNLNHNLYKVIILSGHGSNQRGFELPNIKVKEKNNGSKYVPKGNSRKFIKEDHMYQGNDGDKQLDYLKILSSANYSDDVLFILFICNHNINYDHEESEEIRKLKQSYNTVLKSKGKFILFPYLCKSNRKKNVDSLISNNNEWIDKFTQNGFVLRKFEDVDMI